MKKIIKHEFIEYLMIGDRIASCHLIGAVIEEQTIGSDISGSQFDFVLFRNCDFKDIKIQDTSFNKCRFEGCRFKGVHLEKNSLNSTQFENSKFEEFTISNGSLILSQWHACTLLQSICKNSTASYGAWRKCVFEGFGFHQCDLRFTDFQESEFSEISFYSCDMSGAEFRGMQMHSGMIKDTNMTAAGLDEVKIERLTMIKVNCFGLSVVATDLSNLDRSDVQWSDIIEKTAQETGNPK